MTTSAYRTTTGRVITDAPLPQDQNEQRARRRGHQRNHLRATFDLGIEVAEVLKPLGDEIATLKHAARLRPALMDVADSVHEMLSACIGLATEFNSSGGATSRRALADLAPRPPEPDIAPQQITDGSWVLVLVAHVEPYSAALADVLGRALPPGDERLRGELSASERVESALRLVDAAVRDLMRRVPNVRRGEGLPTMDEFNAQLKADAEARRRAELEHRASMSASRGTATDIADLAGRVAARHIPPRPAHLSPGTTGYLDGSR